MMDTYMSSATHFHDHQAHHGHHPDDPNTQTGHGLLRFRSAPSSLFNEYVNGSTTNEEEEFSEFYEKKPQILLNSPNSSSSGSSSGFSSSSQLPPQYPKQGGGGGGLSRSNSMDMNQSMPPVSGGLSGGGGGGGGGAGLNLSRQSSSPAGFFSQLNPQNGYTIMRGIGNYRVGTCTNGESSPRLSRLGVNPLPRIPEISNENTKETSPAGFTFPSWDDSASDASHLSETSGLSSRPVLAHHLSLPKTATEMAAIENLLHFQDTVPCKVRAKRGCATHPRSIAERVRRNRISDRMRNLQDLVPNMDKQTNTADMLDLAVDYIKNLQSQYKVLNDQRAKCTCVELKHS